MRAASIITICLLLGFARISGQSFSDSRRSAIEAIQAGQYDHAHALLQPALVQTPNDSRLWVLDGLALARSGQEQEALKSYNRALELSPQYLPALQGAAELEFKARTARAPALLGEIVKIQPANEMSHTMLATLAFEHGDCLRAEEEFAKSQTVIATQPIALEQRGSCLVKLKKLANAVVVFEQLAKSAPDNFRFRFNLALTQLLAGRYRDVISTLNASSQNRRDSDALDLLSEAYEHLSDTPEAVAALREAIVLKPDTPQLYLHFADLCLSHASFQAGIDMLNAGLTRLPNAASLYLARGILQIQLGQYELAERDFSKAELLDPSAQYASALQGMAKLQENNLSAAAEIIQKRIVQHPQDAFLHYLLAETLARNGAIPSSPEFKQAVAAAETAVRLNPKLGLARDVLGRLYLQEGRTEEAVKESRMAYSDDPTDQTALYHLIVALRKSGKGDEVPALTKQLATIREQAREKEINERQFAIVSSQKE